jgi:hypothetical protein
MAAEAKVKTVVLYHLTGGPGQRGSIEDAFVPDVCKYFNGPVIVGAESDADLGKSSHSIPAKPAASIAIRS